MGIEKKDRINVKFYDDSKEQIKKGTRLIDIVKFHQNKYESVIVAAKVNNIIRELSYKLDEDSEVEFIDLTYDDGIRIYLRSLTFLQLIFSNSIPTQITDTSLIYHSDGSYFQPVFSISSICLV